MLSVDWEVRNGYPAKRVIGVDEVGRGCLAGPVVAAAVLLPSQILSEDESLPWLDEINDSKKLSHKKRVQIASQLKEWVKAYGIGFASPEEIDAINILQASHVAMKRAVEELEKKLGKSIHHVLVDGHILPRGWEKIGTPVVKGDSASLSIASASIIAKVFRDEWMGRLDQEFPGYGLAVHKGYPTGKHLEAIEALGVTAIHRKSFGPIKERLL